MHFKQLAPTLPKTPMKTIFPTTSLSQNLPIKLPTLRVHYRAIPVMEPTLPEGLLPELPGLTRGIDTTLGGMGNIGVKPQKYLGARWQQKSPPP